MEQFIKTRNCRASQHTCHIQNKIIHLVLYETLGRLIYRPTLTRPFYHFFLFVLLFVESTGKVGEVLSAHGPTAFRVDGNISVRLSRWARHAARPPADAALRGPRSFAAEGRLANAAQSPPPADGPREIRRVSGEDQHRGLSCSHRHPECGV